MKSYTNLTNVALCTVTISGTTHVTRLTLRVDCAPGVSQTSSGQRSKQRVCYTFICPMGLRVLPFCILIRFEIRI